MSRTSTAAAAFSVPVEASGRDTSMVSIGRIGIPAFRGRQFRRGAEQQGRDTPRWSFGEEPVPGKGGQPRGSGKQKRNAPSVYARSVASGRSTQLQGWHVAVARADATACASYVPEATRRQRLARIEHPRHPIRSIAARRRASPRARQRHRGTFQAP